METRFAVGRLTQSYVKAALQSTIYNNTHLEQRLTLCQVDLGLRKKEIENGRGCIFSLSFLRISFPPFHPRCGIFPVPLLCLVAWCWTGAFTPDFSLWLSFVYAVRNTGPTFFFAEATRIKNGKMAHFPPKICFKYIFTHSRDLWFKLEYILPRSWFSEGGSEGFHEAQICRKKKSSHAALSIFLSTWPKMSLSIVWKLLWIDNLWMLLKIENRSALFLDRSKGSWI